MSAEAVLASLVPAFRANVQALMAACLVKGIDVVPYNGLRSIEDQARLWRRSRSTVDADNAVNLLRVNGAPFLANVLASIGPQPPGPWATNALPGNSWHQWGEACDLFIRVNGKADWNGPDYATMSNEAVRIGLTSGYHWKQPDRDHVQLRPGNAPTDALPWTEIDARFAK